jgi:hypothetical protein
MRTTTVVWIPGTPTPAEQQQMQVQVDLMVSEGKTDGTYTFNTVDNLNYVVRSWIDETSAGEWVAYIAAYNPVSAQIDPI